MKNRTYTLHFDRFEDRLVPAATALYATRAAAEVQMKSIVRQADFSAVPIDEMTGTYQGKTGGLYGDGRNDVPETLAKAAEEGSRAIRPLDSKGNPSTDGRIGMLAIGQSTTRMVFDAFRSVSRNAKASNLVLVNGAIDGNDSEDWATKNGPWNQASKQIGRAGLSTRQIEVLWIETTLIFPGRISTFAARNSVLVNHLDQILYRAKQQFPNLRMIFVSSRYYGGWAQKPTSPEPYAYENGFGVREFVLSKMSQPTGSNGSIVPKPVVMWGPYYWTSGTSPSRIDGLTLDRSDLRTDGIHPTASGAAKFADQLLRFFTQDRFAKPWFAKGNV